MDNQKELWLMIAAVGLALLIALSLVRDLGAHIERLRVIRADQATVAPLLTIEATRNAALRAEKEEVDSPQYVEQWGREIGRMTRPGEVLLIVPEQPTAPR